jgi:hypothetical protein
VDEETGQEGQGFWKEIMCAFVWLDYSERERRKMLDVVDLFREHGIVAASIGIMRNSHGTADGPTFVTLSTMISFHRTGMLD